MPGNNQPNITNTQLNMISFVGIDKRVNKKYVIMSNLRKDPSNFMFTLKDTNNGRGLFIAYN